MPHFSRCISLLTDLSKVVLFLLVLHVQSKHKAKFVTCLKKDIIDFKSTWCKVRTARYDWKRILAPCLSFAAWNKNCLNANLHTDAKKSFIKNKHIKAAGFFSRFLIQSVLLNGTRKTFGGDSWRVYIHGPSTMSAQVFDKNDGTYEIVFLPLEPGNYEATILLDYSLCNGLKDPPYDWFRRGTYHMPNKYLL